MNTTGKVKVLQVLNSLGRGGIETLAVGLYDNIDREKVQCDFAIMEGKPTDHLDWVISRGAKVYVYPALTARTLVSFLDWWDKFYKEHHEYDIVHGHVFTTAAFYLPYAKKAGCYTIVHSHNTDINTAGRTKLNVFMRRLALRPLRNGKYIDERFACSKEAGEWLFGREGKFEVIHNGVDLRPFMFSEKVRASAREKLNISNDTFVVGHVGNGVGAKNHMFLLKIFLEIHKLNPDAVLLLVGGLSMIEPELSGYINENNLGENIKILGVRDDVPQLMMAMDMFVFPSFFEGLGIVLIEAQATGLPCLVSDVIPAEAKVSTQYEVLSLQKPALVWAQKTMELYGQVSDKRENAWQQAKENGYDIEDVARDMQQFYIAHANR